MAKNFNTTDDINTGDQTVSSILTGDTPKPSKPAAVTTGEDSKGKDKPPKDPKEQPRRTSIIMKQRMFDQIKALADLRGDSVNAVILEGVQRIINENTEVIARFEKFQDRNRKEVLSYDSNRKEVISYDKKE